MRITITGGTGFLGSAIVDVLCEEGHDPSQIQAIARRPDPILEAKGVTCVAASILDGATLTRAFEGTDIVFHLAGRVTRRRSAEAALQRLHVDGTRLVLETAETAGVKRVIYASTSGTVGCGTTSDFMARDDDPDCMPVVGGWPYYATKIAAERMTMRFCAKHDMPVIILNPSLLLGPGDRRGSSTADVARFLAGKIPSIPRGGLNFVDVRDAARAFVAAMTQGESGKRHLIGGTNMSLEDFFGQLSTLSGVKGPRFRLPVSLELLGGTLFETAARVFKTKSAIDRISAEMAQVFWYFEGRRAEEALGFQARDAEETLRDTIADVKARQP